MRPFLPTLILAASFSLSAHALPGEATAVIQHCGVPHAENFTTSQVTGKPQRDLIYNALTLHFEPLEGGWSFTTAWRGHFPITRSELESELPCFRAALAEAAAVPLPVIDPTIARQTTTTSPMNSGTFGIPHLWLILALAVSLIVLMLIPRKSNAAPATRFIERRPYRKPSTIGREWRQRPPLPPLE